MSESMRAGFWLVCPVGPDGADISQGRVVSGPFPKTAGAGPPLVPAPGGDWLPPWLVLAGPPSFDFTDDRNTP